MIKINVWPECCLESGVRRSLSLTGTKCLEFQGMFWFYPLGVKLLEGLGQRDGIRKEKHDWFASGPQRPESPCVTSFTSIQINMGSHKTNSPNLLELFPEPHPLIIFPSFLHARWFSLLFPMIFSGYERATPHYFHCQWCRHSNTNAPGPSAVLSWAGTAVLPGQSQLQMWAWGQLLYPLKLLSTWSPFLDWVPWSLGLRYRTRPGWGPVLGKHYLVFQFQSFPRILWGKINKKNQKHKSTVQVD